MQNNIHEKLSEMALRCSIPYCMGCHQEAKGGRCQSCGSDDLGNLLRGYDCDWGVDWIIEEILRNELTPVNLEEAFEESVRQSFPETIQALWMTLDAVSVCKEMDPISWSIALGEWTDQESEEGTITSMNNGSTFYWSHDIEKLLDVQ